MRTIRILDLTGRWSNQPTETAVFVDDVLSLTCEGRAGSLWVIGAPTTPQLEAELLDVVRGCHDHGASVGVAVIAGSHSPSIDRTVIRLAAESAGARFDFTGHDLRSSPTRMMLVRNDGEEADLREDLTMHGGGSTSMFVWTGTHLDIIEWPQRFMAEPAFRRFEHKWWCGLNSTSRFAVPSEATWPPGVYSTSGLRELGGAREPITRARMHPLSLAVQDAEDLHLEAADPSIGIKLAGDVIPLRVVSGWLTAVAQSRLSDDHPTSMIDKVVAESYASGVSPIAFLLHRCASEAINDLLMRNSDPDATVAHFAALGDDSDALAPRFHERLNDDEVETVVWNVVSEVEQRYLRQVPTTEIDSWAHLVVSRVIQPWANWASSRSNRW